MGTISFPDFREATFRDYAGIAALEERHGMTRLTEEHWKHLWIDNPVYTPKWPIGWVLESHAGKIVGSIGAIPVRYYWGERVLKVSAGRAWVVDEEYRTFAALLMESYLSQPNVDLYLSTTLMPSAAAVFASFDNKRVPVGTWDAASLLVTNYVSFAEGILRMKGVPNASLLKYPAGMGLYVLDSFAGRRPAHPEEDFHCVHTFDARFEDFWQELREQRPHQLLAERSRAALNWHFQFTAGTSGLWVLTATEYGRLTAYSIFERIVNEGPGLNRMRLVDYQSVVDEDYLPAMLAFAYEKCRQSGIHSLDIIGQEVPGWHHRKLPSWRYHYKTYDPVLTTELEKPQVWNPSLYDGNATL